MRRYAGILALEVVVSALAGCGGGGSGGGPTDRARVPPPGASAPPTTPVPPPSTPAPPTPPPAGGAPLLPPAVPRSGGRSADPGDLAVVKRWLAAETHADFAAAAATFADGARVENASPVIVLRDRRARLAFTSAFPCGAEVVSATSKAGYLLVTYRLTDRVGSKCDGPGNEAYGAIRIRGGRMTEWYRLADPPQAPKKAGPVV